MKSWQRLSSSSVVTPGWTYGSIMSSTLAANRPAARILSCSAGDLMVTFMAALSFISGRCSWYKARLFLTTPHACRHNRPGARRFPCFIVCDYRLFGPLARVRRVADWDARRLNPTRSFNDDQRVNATDAGSGRPFWASNPLLEPEDGSVHFRRTKQDPHHQPREDSASVRTGLGLHQGRCRRRRQNIVRGHQTFGPRCRPKGGRALQHALCEPALAGRHAHQFQDHSAVHQAAERIGRDGTERFARSPREERGADAAP